MKLASWEASAPLPRLIHYENKNAHTQARIEAIYKVLSHIQNMVSSDINVYRLFSETSVNS